MVVVGAGLGSAVGGGRGGLGVARRWFQKEEREERILWWWWCVHGGEGSRVEREL